MKLCFLCNQPTTRLRHLHHITAPPTTAREVVPICPACNPDWTFALLEELRSNIAFLNQTPPGQLDFARPQSDNK